VTLDLPVRGGFIHTLVIKIFNGKVGLPSTTTIEASNKMASAAAILNINWQCRQTWQSASYNTVWCLIGCSIGDIGTIAIFDVYNIAWPTSSIMALAIMNGLLTSIVLETFILCRQMTFTLAMKTALGMSLISMIAMELAMNLTDIAITGGAKITPVALPIMLLAGFLTPLPYNYWRLKALGKACH